MRDMLTLKQIFEAMPEQGSATLRDLARALHARDGNVDSGLQLLIEAGCVTVARDDVHEYLYTRALGDIRIPDGSVPAWDAAQPQTKKTSDTIVPETRSADPLRLHRVDGPPSGPALEAARKMEAARAARAVEIFRASHDRAEKMAVGVLDRIPNMLDFEAGALRDAADLLERRALWMRRESQTSAPAGDAA